jgi:CSLREA domain-containing protein
LKVLVSVLVAAACLVVSPTLAAAATFTVDSVNDEQDAGGLNGVCLSVGLKCTLRAAIEESNTSTGTTDTIKFASNPFDGQLADTIAISTSLPTITDPVHIDGDANAVGGQCTTAAAVKGPCVGVSGPAAGSALTVQNSNGVEIEGLAVSGVAAGTAINVIDSSTGFQARDNWIGVKLDGSAGANNKGIFLDPDSDGATIGGLTAEARNVISNSNLEGLDAEGADSVVIQGNYFGVAPDGSTQAANAKDIEVSGSTSGGGFSAANALIGAKIGGTALESEACDGGCNVVSGASSVALDLTGNGSGMGEEPALAPIVRGNYVGLNAAGQTPVASSATFDILVGEADEARIGGPDEGDANFVAGGGYGVYAENGDTLQIFNNEIGFNQIGNQVTSPSTAGMFIFSLSATIPAVVSENAIHMDGGVGIEQRFGGAEISENLIVGGQYGVLTKGEPGAFGGNLIAGNAILAPEVNGVLIENDLNEVLGNIVTESGDAAIRVQNPAPLLVATENLIGGDSGSEENTFLANGGPAIEIVDPVDASEDSENEVARNKGLFNGSPFIDLVGEANGGIQPPAFATTTQSTASGTGAVAGAKIRVFANATKSPGQIGGFLAETVADGKGSWKVTYPTIATGTAVGATQTNPAGGTSELSYATASADPSGGGKDKTKEPDAIVDPLCAFTAGKCRWPETIITGAPKGKTHATTVKFRFSSDMPGSTFECKLDKKPFKPCKSPKKYKKLKPGKHVFKVRATDTQGRVDPVPAKKKFRILAAD